MKKLFLKSETIAFGFLIAWCSLPIFMSIYTPILEILGKLPTHEEILEEFGGYSGFNYSVVLNSYYTFFYILGAITVIFALFVIVAGLKQVLDKRNLKTKPWYYFLLALILWSVVCALLSDDFSIALTGNYYLCDNLCSYFIYASVFVCASLIKDKQKRIFLIKYFAYMILYLSLIMIVEECSQLEILTRLFPSRRAVVFNQFNHFGYMLCMTIIVFMTLYLYEEKNIYLVFFAIEVYAILMNDTFGSYLASVFAVPVAAIIYKFSGHKLTIKKLLPLFIFVLLSALSIFGLLPCANTLGTNLGQFGTDLGKIASSSEDKGKAGTGRMTLWLDTIERIKERPIFGYGPMGFTGDNAITNGDSPHNEYLQITGFLGFPGLFMYLGSLISLCIIKFKQLKQLHPYVLIAGCALIGYLFSACFGNPVFNTYPYLWLFFGLTSDDTLIDLSADEIIEELDSKTDKKHATKVIVATLIFSIVFYLGFTAYLRSYTEKQCELADLEMMSIAKQSSIAGLDSEVFEVETVYYYDGANFSISTEKPEPYGMGSTYDANGMDEFELENGDVDFDYDEKCDYSDKVIQIIIHSKDDVEITWVD